MMQGFVQTGAKVAALVAAGLLAGGLNAIAGEGSFIRFTALLLCQVPPIAANATNSLATWPGLFSASWGYRLHLRPHWSRLAIASLLSVAGVTAGGLLILHTPAEVFSHLIPYLLLSGTVLFLLSFFRLGPGAAEEITGAQARNSLPQKVADLRSFAQFAMELYGGYFAGGVGILQIAALSVFGIEDMQFLLGLKNLFGVLMSGASLVALMSPLLHDFRKSSRQPG